MFPGRVDTPVPEAASLPGRWIGSGRIRAGGAWRARQPRGNKIGPALSSSNTIGWQPCADPVQKHDPGSGKRRKKGIDNQGPVTEGVLASY